MKRFAPVLLFALLLTGWQEIASGQIEVANRRELFVDDYLIESLDGTDLNMHSPQLEGVALQFDQPWEGAFCGYVTVLQDGSLYRMYYRGLPEAGSDGSSREVTCYAESEDGINWTKPELGLFEVRGTRQNNVILADAAPVTHNFCPFLDTREDVPEDERYKALGGTAKSGLIGYKSPDGIHWTRMQEEPLFRDTDWVFDSQNVPFWSEAEGRYVLYYRKSLNRIRAIGRATSPDFRSWSDPVQMTFGDTKPEHLYTNQTRPYVRAPHIYVGVAARFMPGRQVLTAEEAEAIHVNPKYFGDISDAVLLTTRGGSRYHRTFMESFIRPGQGIENWVSRTNYPALGIVPTGDDQLSVYVQKNYGQPTARLDRYTLRPDGFISVNAPYAGGEMTTKTLTFGDADTQGPRELALNFATSAAGSIRIEVQDAEGNPIEGYTLADSPELIGDDVGRVVSWKGGSDLSALADRGIRLRFVMNDADLYAIQFE